MTFARARLCNRPAPRMVAGTWTPERDMIRRLESVLARELQTALDAAPESRMTLVAADYYRQYAGLIVGGRRIVYVNGLHQKAVARDIGSRTPWQTTAWHPCDGGLLFFGAEYDVETETLSRLVFNGGGRGASGATQSAIAPVPPELAALAARASLDGRITAWCRGTIGFSGEGFAVAVTTPTTRDYLALERDGRATTLASFSGLPDLACYTRREAEQLDRTIRESETVEGKVTPRWDSTVVCGFVNDTEAICWQFSPDSKSFVVVGRWTT
jgi:hypothetical protein